LTKVFHRLTKVFHRLTKFSFVLSRFFNTMVIAKARSCDSLVSQWFKLSMLSHSTVAHSYSTRQQRTHPVGLSAVILNKCVVSQQHLPVFTRFLHDWIRIGGKRSSTESPKGQRAAYLHTHTHTQDYYAWWLASQ
jgi:hypothetical protein